MQLISRESMQSSLPEYLIILFWTGEANLKLIIYRGRIADSFSLAYWLVQNKFLVHLIKMSQKFKLLIIPLFHKKN